MFKPYLSCFMTGRTYFIFPIKSEFSIHIVFYIPKSFSNMCVIKKKSVVHIDNKRSLNLIIQE